MRSHDGIAQFAVLAERRAQRDRQAARHARARADRLEYEARELQQQSNDQLRAAQLSETHDLSRQGLFTLLRGLAIARAHALECDLRMHRLREQAQVENESADQLAGRAGQHQSRARRLQAIYQQLRRDHQRALLRRQEHRIQEDYACQ